MSEKYIDLTEEIWRADEGRTSGKNDCMTLTISAQHHASHASERGIGND